jgi:hypothetical protein
MANILRLVKRLFYRRKTHSAVIYSFTRLDNHDDYLSDDMIQRLKERLTDAHFDVQFRHTAYPCTIECEPKDKDA